ncbi:MAG: hypothetical protein ACRCTE_06040 [Cellulosilyticaceae bacterium]
MNHNIKFLKEIVEDYFSGKKSKKEVGEWAHNGYYELLKGNYLEMDKLMVYPFVKKLSKIHIEGDPIKDNWPCSLEEISQLREILLGRKNQNYSLNIAIPWNISLQEFELNPIKKSQYLKLMDILRGYSDQKEWGREAYKVGSQILQMPEDREGTIPFILEMYIKSFLEKSIDGEEVIFKLGQGMGLYVKRKNSHVEILSKVIRYLECYVGEREIGVDILFVKGEPQIIITCCD